jgi:hypothetical protein
MLKKGGSTSRPISKTRRGGNVKDMKGDPMSRLISEMRMEAVKGGQHQCQSQDIGQGEVPMSKLRSMTRRSVNVKARMQNKEKCCQY